MAQSGNNAPHAHHTNRRRAGRSRRFVALVAVIVTAAAVSVLAAASASANLPGTAAAYTSVDTAIDGSGHCLNNSPVNCNIYDGKQFVWLNGGPVGTALGAGDYFFAVLQPGGQADPNDGTPNNLSSPIDAYSNRTFSVTSGGVVTYSGTHDFDDNKVRLADYADTGNAGGVYILAICSLSNGVPVVPSDCKYDAFKVGADQGEPGLPLTVTKSAAGAYTDTYSWTIGKAVDKTLVKQVGGSATFHYTVTVGNDGGVISGVGVSGTITVTNPNVDAGNNTVAVSGVDVTDTLSDGTSCTVTGGTDATLTDFHTDFAYSCSLPGVPQSEDNTVSVTWPDQPLTNGSVLDSGSADFTFHTIAFTPTLVDNCVTVTDSFAGSLGTVCSTDANPTQLTYSRTIPVPAFDCASFPNTATFTADSGATGSASQSVTVCGPVRTGALTIGFWQNKIGQGIVSGQAKTGTCASATWLRQFAPFQDLSATATCAAVGTYVANVIKAATCSGSTCNAMLKAQMLATALNVYFSDPALGGNKIGAPHPLGGVTIDLTQICAPIASPCGGYEDVGAAFGGASSLTVSAMLTFAASQSNAGGTSWYGQVKATQTLAKDAFDAINNQVAFAV